MDQATSSLLRIVIPTYRWHTQMFDNMVKDLSAEHAAARIEGRTNNITWTLGNLVNCRYWMANVMGIDDKDPNEEFFKEGKPYDAAVAYPSPEELKSAWHEISQPLFSKLLEATDEQLNEAYNFGMSVAFVEENKLNMVGMGMDRCAYLLGQLGLLRRAVANLGTSYDVNDNIQY